MPFNAIARVRAMLFAILPTRISLPKPRAAGRDAALTRKLRSDPFDPMPSDLEAGRRDASRALTLLDDCHPPGHLPRAEARSDHLIWYAKALGNKVAAKLPTRPSQIRTLLTYPLFATAPSPIAGSVSNVSPGPQPAVCRPNPGPCANSNRRALQKSPKLPALGRRQFRERLGRSGLGQ